MFSALRATVSCQGFWRLVHHRSPLLVTSLSRRPHIKINSRTFILSSVMLQEQTNTSSSLSTSKLSPLMGDSENQSSKTPFIFSKTSSEPKFTKSSSSKDDDEQRERAARAALDVRMLKYTGYFLGIWLFSTLGYIILIWGSPQLDENGQIIRDQYSDLPSWQQYIKRSYHGVLDYWQQIKDPTSNSLLPDPLPPGIQPLYTLAIEMSGVLLNPEWAYNTGWRYKKRPGLDHFLREIGYPTYEVIIYTKETSWTAASVIENMDSEHRIMYRLFRENTRFINGAHVKDLSCLNRDLKKTIFLDWDENSYQLQPRNALHRLKKWNGEEDDRQLLHLAAFLKLIAVSGVEDVRDVLDHYNQESDPLEAFLIRQQKLLEVEEQKRLAAANNPAKKTKGLFSNWSRQF